MRKIEDIQELRQIQMGILDEVHRFYFSRLILLILGIIELLILRRSNTIIIPLPRLSIYGREWWKRKRQATKSVSIWISSQLTM